MDVLTETLAYEFDHTKPTIARENIDNLLTSLELVKNLIDYPHESDYSEDFFLARSCGIEPNLNTLPHIFKGYFSIPLNDFLTEKYNIELLTEFEEECIKDFPLIDHDQLSHAYSQLLMLYEMCAC